MGNGKLHIALMGTRGIPARYGGFETFAEELSTRLVDRGYRVTVYARRKFFEKTEPEFEYKSVQVVKTPTIMHKYLETPLHSLFGFLSIKKDKPDLILLCNAANSPFAFIAKFKGIPLLINVDGVERLRKKWNSLGKLWYKLGERCSVKFATKIIADAKVIKDYYVENYDCEPVVIAYGADAQSRSAGKTLKEFYLEPKKYLLYVSRLEPENNALGVIQAYNSVKTSMPLVIVGDAPYAKDYINSLKKAANNNVIFTGYQFGEAYQELQSNCYAYIQATEVGGTHPALLEAMAYGNCIIANDTPEHKEALEDTGVYYEKNNFEDLTKRMQVVVDSHDLIDACGRKARERQLEYYTWDHITDLYEELILEVLGLKRDSDLDHGRMRVS